MKGRAAIVTGAASGIGRAIATDLAAAGARVLFADINVDDGKRAAAEYSTSAFQNADTAKQADCDALVTRAVRDFGGVDILVNNASVHGLVASPYKSAYVAAKHGLVGFTKAVALEAAEKGVTVNAVCPSYVRTPLVEKQIADQAKVHGISEDAVIRDIMLAPAALKRLLEPSEVAAYVRFLCSDEASGITGATQVIDAGWTAR
jgi:3-hydroxybutyrate dehydrogenase